jgi:hypothetical protein
MPDSTKRTHWASVLNRNCAYAPFAQSAATSGTCNTTEIDNSFDAIWTKPEMPLSAVTVNS